MGGAMLLATCAPPQWCSTVPEPQLLCLCSRCSRLMTTRLISKSFMCIWSSPKPETPYILSQVMLYHRGHMVHPARKSTIQCSNTVVLHNDDQPAGSGSTTKGQRVPANSCRVLSIEHAADRQPAAGMMFDNSSANRPQPQSWQPWPLTELQQSGWSSGCCGACSSLCTVVSPHSHGDDIGLGP